jgi:hypothetical protein
LHIISKEPGCSPKICKSAPMFSSIAIRLSPTLASICMCFSTLWAQGQKSTITITSPAEGTVWTVEDLAELRWTVEHIGPEKSIRFFLVREETVVQELGSFANNGFKDGIALAKNIGSGDQYQVVGIELFPDDKFNVAKYITPVFSIVNKASDERQRQQETKKPAPQKAQKKKKRTRSKKNEDGAVAAPPQKSAPVQRMEFEGRKISYTKELHFDSEDITVKIWDHGRQDGDIVSIYINGAPVVSKYYLTYYKREFKIKLDPKTSNDLFLYAHNLGEVPPNTVSVEISDGKKSENIILNSDLQSCEAVMISVR